MITANKLIFESAKVLSVQYEKCCDALIYIDTIHTIESFGASASSSSKDVSSEIILVLDAEKIDTHAIPGNVILFLVISSEQYAETARCIFDRADPEGGCIVKGDINETITMLLRIQQSYVQAESEFFSSILRQEKDEDILHKAEAILGYPFSLYWKDFRCLFISEELSFMNEESGDMIEANLGLQLIMNKKFHDVIQYHVPFYYYESYRDLYNYCRNIFSGSEYLARLVLVLPRGKSKLHPGEEEVFSILTDYLSTWGLNHSKLFRDNLPNAIHELLSQNAKGIPVEKENWNTILNTIDWSVNDRYTIINYQFLPGEKWMVHKEITLAFLIAQLEREWPYSCAIQQDDNLIWLINLTKTGVQISSDEFHQRVAAFIREYVCVAGVSPEFHDITQIPYALKAADISLRLGRKKDPHYWYYLYEDYREHFMRQSLLQELPLSMLVSPTLLFLEEYDRENQTELLKTLRAYLLNGFNMTNAANKLFVHRTTFFRRMEKIEVLTGLNLEDESACQNLLVGIWLME